MTKTDYAHHEGVYQDYKTQRKPQWSDQTQLDKDTRRLGHLLSYPEDRRRGSASLAFLTGLFIS
ncbi:MAG: hypothetical protein HOL98_14600 [Gammaproteobacteria bacterium]|jgi:hypothetical protein|nr:hypothetical protein [Gammaproteobacteria bacterium]MBT5204686.1 hypothetical protein [Gammaproteobacteria bacterium]MBT5601972.1 hypothetical protein [Gammaproteobacteria bacterium]MBT6243891.1 hypothetical protein [Gammaproteobacteria bacterium]